MKGRLLTTISIVLFVAGIVTLNLNSAVWAKDDSKINSKDSFKISENTNRDINTQTNDDGNTETSTQRSNNCDPEPQCHKNLDNAMGMLNDLIKPTLP